MPNESRQLGSLRPTKADKEMIDQIKGAYDVPTDIGAVRLALMKACNGPRHSIEITEDLWQQLEGMASHEIEAMLREALQLRRSGAEWEAMG